MHLKALVAGDLATRRFIRLRLDGPPILGEIVVAVPLRRRVSPLIEEFIRFMRTELQRLQSQSRPTPVTRSARKIRTRLANEARIRSSRSDHRE
jgi:hypothetical protein